MHYSLPAFPPPQEGEALCTDVPALSKINGALRGQQAANPAIADPQAWGGGAQPSSQHTPAQGQPAAAGKPQVAPAPDAPLPAAELSTRTYNALRRGRITTIQQLCALELHDLRWLRSFGSKALAETVAYRAQLGMPLKLPE